MLRILTIFIFSAIFLFAQNQHVEVLADSLKKNGVLVIAKGNVLVYSERYLISANKALYNNKTGDLELFGNVNLIEGIGEAVKSKYVKINIKQEVGKFKPFFTYNENKDMWIECERAEGKEDYYITKNAITSSCNVQDPDWKIGFDRGKYDKKTKFLQLRNVFFYIRNVPVFYLPYFAISTDTRRKTGLLIPSAGLDKTEGYYLSQPIYIAEYEQWDLEILPQIRTKRGVGAYVNFRFADTANSHGNIKIGAFKNKNKFKQQEQLKNKIHKGAELNYESESLLESYLKNEDVDDGALIDATYLNDIDYLNLQDDDDGKHESLVTSKANYFIRNGSNYAGLYAKYYIDTKKVSNSDTLQELPTMQYHHFINKIHFPNLLYSFDLQYHRYARKRGIGANQIEASLPISFHTNFFDDYLKVSASERLYATYIKYNQTDGNEEDYYFKNYQVLSAYTDLARSYDNFYHTMAFGLDYVIPGTSNGEIEEDFIRKDIETKGLHLNFLQYFYDKNGQKRIKHSMKQNFKFDDEYENVGDFTNNLAYYFTDDMYIKNEFRYSFEHSRVAKVKTTFHANYDRYAADLIHVYDRDEKRGKLNFLIASAKATYAKNYTFYAQTNYNIKEGYAESWRVGLKRQKKCWNYAIYYKEDMSPKLTSVGSDFIRKKGIYISFELYPLGGTSYDFSTASKKSN